MSALVKKMRTYDRSKKILISPRYAGKKWHETTFPLTPEQHARQFDFIFGEVGEYIDAAAFMDGHCLFENLPLFAAATAEVCAKYGIEFWSNLETFSRDMPYKFPPIDWMKLRYKMDVVQPCVSKIITFEAPHFLSPYSIFPSARNLYDRYMEYIGTRV